VLGLTARLETDAKRRLNETAQFHLDVMEPGGLEYGAHGFSDVRHVRLMHAAVRWLIEHDPRAEWDPAWGTPINQEDLLETLLTFTEIVFEVFDRTGIIYTEDEANHYLHAWSVIGFHLGGRRPPAAHPRANVGAHADRAAAPVRPQRGGTDDDRGLA
jgi:hypothetical protein